MKNGFSSNLYFQAHYSFIIYKKNNILNRYYSPGGAAPQKISGVAGCMEIRKPSGENQMPERKGIFRAGSIIIIR